MDRILIVEDDPDIAGLVRLHLEKAGLSAWIVGDGKQALDLALRNQPALIVLDLMLPGMDGLEICRRLRADAAMERVPIIMLTAKTEEVDRIVGLELGADDYVSKPFSPRELVARVLAVLRRTVDPGPPEEEPLVAGDLRLDPLRHEVTKRGRVIPLSATEFRLLEFFLRNPTRVYTRAQLLDRVWGRDRHVEPRTVDVHIRRLREKLEEDAERPALIVTVRGTGYKCGEGDGES